MRELIRTKRDIPVYRPDIDGLRAIAVLGVIVYHASPALMRGGFVGVDVFFVISGYLITGIITREMENGTFSIAKFYARRIRRIFPGLCVTLTLALGFGLVFLYPYELKSLSEQSLAAVLFAGNFYYWVTTDYFAQASDQLALLHLWTLGLEEQYYLIWPVTLLLISLARLNVKFLVLSALLLSFALNLKYYRWSPEWTFFLPPARFWELFAGSLLALLPISELTKARRATKARDLLSALAIFALIFSLFKTDELRFPGWQVVTPVMATFMLILSGPYTWIARHVLSNRLMIWIGLVSYPLYLYHWPLLVYFNSIVLKDNTRIATAVSITISFVFAAITYHFIESPIRKSKTKSSLLALVFIAILLAVLSALILSGHLKGRIQSSDVAKVEAAIGDWEMPSDNFKKIRDFDLLELREGQSNILVFGDSHASQYYSWFKFHLPEISKSGLGVQFAAYGGCAPLPDINRLEPGYGCPQFYDFVMDYTKSDSVNTIIVSAWWEHYFGLRNGIPDAEPLLNMDLSGFAPVAAKFADDLENLAKSGKRVVVLLSNPTSPKFDPRNMLSRIDGGISTSGIARTDFLEYVNPVSNIIRQELDRPGIEIIDPTAFYCVDNYCPSLDEDGLPIYKDDHHLRSSYLEKNADFMWDFLK